MGNLFNMDNKFFVFMGRVADLMILNILCIVCCIPIVTIGPAVTAMFYVTMKMVKNEESYIVKSFFKSFKENFKQGVAIHLILVVVAVVLLADLKIMAGMEGNIYKILYTIFLAFGVIYIMIYMYVYPVLAKFYNTIKRTFLNAMLMSIRHLPYTFLMVLVTVAPFAAALYIPIAGVQSVLMLGGIMVGFSLITYINAHFFVKIFDNYVKKDEEVEDERSEEEIEEDRWNNLEVLGNRSEDETAAEVIEEAAVTTETEEN